ncbi:alpha/beta hydrolase family protein [Archangium lipolyticum]|uniref:alpha/beta hydrolase family protein n=1 Tax=Archangium lipolyticum TaxID=2970465 RepID=UPI002149CC52|nr:alpha/beta hydrolase [Archangium lipolyticum]
MATPVHEHDFFFSGEGVRLAGTLSRTPGTRPLPALILISGSGAHDRDETVCGHKPFKIIADFFSRRGYAVLRYDDRGVGGSSGESERTEFSDSVADAKAAFRSLASTAGIDGSRISFCGHSEGGLVAASAADGLRIQSVVMLASPAVPIEPLLHAQARALSLEAGATERQLTHERRMNEAVFEMARGPAQEHVALREITRIIGEFLRTWPDLPPAEPDTVALNAREMARIVCAPAYRSLLRQSPRDILGSVRKPMLAVFGGRDCQVPGPENLAAFQQAAADNPWAETLLFEDMNHLFQATRTGSMAEYEALPPGPAEEVLRAIEDWLGRRHGRLAEEGAPPSG